MQRKFFRGDVGIGTLIVFIAMVLVAAIAATVLLNVSGMLQQKASTTGKETTKQVSSNIIVSSVIGHQESISSANINNLIVTLKAASGSGKIDLKNMLIRIDNGTSEAKLTSAAGGASANAATSTKYGLIERVDPNNIFDATTGTYVLDSSSLVDINISLNVSGVTLMNLTPRSILTMELIPEVGTPVSITMSCPEVYHTTIISLYP